jgi:hypothetical protein
MVQPAPGRHGALDDPGQLIQLGHVALERAGLAARGGDLSRHVLGGFAVEVGQGHRIAVARQPQGDGAPDPLPGAGDQGRFHSGALGDESPSSTSRE